MIYLLIEHIGECEYTMPVFASASKESCENKHSELLTRNLFYKRIANHLDNCYKEEVKVLGDRPNLPKLSTLPARPLVWKDGGWQNAYSIENTEAYREYNKKAQVILEDIKTELADTYKVDKDVVSNQWIHFNPTYSIMEVESDIKND